MLLNRRRINRWARWVALSLAIVFAVSFAFLGVGSGMPGMDFSQLWTSDGGSSSTPSADTPEDLIESYEAQLAENPDDYLALMGLANQYEILDQPALAAQYLEKAREVQPENIDVLSQLADIYMNSDVRNAEAAVPVLNKLTELEPDNASAFLMLGSAQRDLGNNQAAILAWNKYLELSTDEELSQTVQGEIDKLTAASDTAPGDGAAPAESAAGSTPTTAP